MYGKCGLLKPNDCDGNCGMCEPDMSKLSSRISDCIWKSDPDCSYRVLIGCIYKKGCVAMYSVDWLNCIGDMCHKNIDKNKYKYCFVCGKKIEWKS